MALEVIQKANPEYLQNKPTISSKPTVGGTLLGATTQIGKGVLGFGEKAFDAALQLGTSKYNPYYLFNKDKLKSHQLLAQEIISENSKQELLDKVGYSKVKPSGLTYQQELDKKSAVKSTGMGGQVLESIGEQLPGVVLGNLGVGKAASTLGSTIPLALSSFGGGVEQAYQSGANRQEANLYGGLNTAVELATEYIVGGVPGVQGGILGGLDTIASKGIGKVSNSIIRALLDSGYKIVGEGAEEALAEILNPLIKNMSYSKGEKVNWKNVVNSAIQGMIVGGLLNAPSSISNIKSGIQEQNAIKQQNKPDTQTITPTSTITPTTPQTSQGVAQIQSQGQNKTTDNVKPIKVYHGSPNANLTELDVAKSGTNTEAEKGALYFTNNKDFAKDFAYERIPTNSEFIEKKGKFGKIYEAELDIKNPLDLTNLTMKDAKNISDLAVKKGLKEITPEKVMEISKYPNGQILKTYFTNEQIKSLGYDGIIAKVSTGFGDNEINAYEYGVFDNNQIKLVDKSQQPTITPQVTTQDNINNAKDFENYYKNIPTENVAPPELSNEKYNSVDTISMDRRTINLLLNNMKQQLGLNKTQMKTLESVIQKFNTDANATEKSLYNDISKEFSEMNIETKLNDILNIQRELRNRKINVSQEIKQGIKDYGQLKLKNFGKIGFSNDGSTVDSVYQELSGTYPDYFPDNIWNPEDQLLKIIEVANMDKTAMEKITLPKEMILEATKYITEATKDYRLGESLKSAEQQAKAPIDEKLIPKEEPTITPQETIGENIPTESILANVPKAEVKKVVDDKVATILSEMPKQVKDDSKLKKLATIKIIDKGYYVDKLARASKNPELSAKYDNMLMANASANNAIGGYGREGSKSLFETFEPIETSKKTKDFQDYMYHQLNVDRMSLVDRGLDQNNKPVFGDTITAETSRNKVAEYESKNPEFKDWAKSIYDYNNANLKYLVQTGVITQEQADYLNEKYPHYVPIKRVDVPSKTNMIEGLKRASIGTPIKVAKGGSADMLPLKEAMALQTFEMEKAGKRNNFAKELSKTLNTEMGSEAIQPDTIIDEDNGEMLTPSTNESPATLTFYDNGVKKTIAISDEIFESLKTSNIPTIKLFNTISNIRRGLLTEFNLNFMITNPMKDVQDGMINSKYPKTFPKNIVEATKQVAEKGEIYKEYVRNGGESNSYFDYEKGFTKEKGITDFYPLRKISELNKAIEMVPRIAEYISTRENGGSVEQAMYNAAEITTNFKRGGDWTKFLNKNGATFLNASVQGAYKQVKNVQEARSIGLKGVANLLTRYVLAGVPFALINQALWGDDDDYQNLSDYVKDSYYILGKDKNGTFIKIPKGRVVSVIQKAVENTGSTFTGKPEEWDGYLELVANQLAPNNPIEENIFSPLVQAASNKAWYGGSLIPRRLENKAPSEQYDESTDEFSKWLGKKTNISPYKINYVIDQYSGAIGDLTLPYITKQAENGNDSMVAKLAAPILAKFTADSTLKNQNVADFYEISDKLTKLKSKENVTPAQLGMNTYFNNTKSIMNNLYKAKRTIQNSDLKDSEKFKQAKEIQKQINDIAKSAIVRYNQEMEK